jgi:hypothetical protein
VIVRLEKFFPAVLDEPVRQQLLTGLFEAWLNEQIDQISANWMGNSQTGVVAV